MKLAVCNTAPVGGVITNDSPSAPNPSFQACRDLLGHQSRPIAARLGRLVTGAERAIRRGAPDRFARARKLEEAVGYVAWVRGTHEESQALRRCVARLLSETFSSLDWRAPLIAGLRPSAAMCEKADAS